MEPGKAEPIRFSFDERRAAAAASLLLQLAGGTMEYLTLIKLLYFVDRDGLDALGRPITGDRYVSMRHGPVLSTVYDLLKQVVSGTPLPGPWAEHIETAGRYTVRLKGAPDMGALSEAEVDLVLHVFEQYRHRDRWSLRDHSHELPEWEDPGESSREIRVETILQVLGKTDEEIEKIREAAQERAYFNLLFSR